MTNVKDKTQKKCQDLNTICFLFFFFCWLKIDLKKFKYHYHFFCCCSWSIWRQSINQKRKEKKMTLSNIVLWFSIGYLKTITTFINVMVINLIIISIIIRIQKWNETIFFLKKIFLTLASKNKKKINSNFIVFSIIIDAILFLVNFFVSDVNIHRYSSIKKVEKKPFIMATGCHKHFFSWLNQIDQ